MKNIFAEAVKLSNVIGRIGYTNAEKSVKKKETTFATFDTAGKEFWQRLAAECQQEFLRSGNVGRIDPKSNEKYRCCEAREFILALPKEFEQIYAGRYDELAKKIAWQLKKMHGVHCNVAIHQNETGTNFHAHIIFSERRELAEPVVTYADRNAFINSQGVRVRTKKEILDPETKQLLPGCKIIKKGEVLNARYFEDKDEYFKRKVFVQEFKEQSADWFNQVLKEHNQEQRYQTYLDDGIHLKTQKVGKKIKDKEKKALIEAKNSLIAAWNQTADDFIASASLVSQEERESAINDCMGLRAQIKDAASDPNVWIAEIQNCLKDMKQWLAELRREFREIFAEFNSRLDDTISRAGSRAGKEIKQKGQELSM